MVWNEKLQIIIDYVEDHLQQKEEPIDPNEVAKIAGCSFDFFQKVFSYMNGISFADYIRQRKLTLAAYDLKSTHEKVVDISYKYGYNSSTSFTKAFQLFHGITPRKARDNDAKLHITPKIQMTHHQQYDWRIVERDAFRVIGKSKTISCKNQEHYETIPAFWAECQKDGTYTQLIAMDSGIPRGLYGFFESYDAKSQHMVYSIMAQSNAPLPEGFKEVWLPEMSWAVFDCRGSVPKAIQQGWDYLTKEWLVQYPFQHAPCPELEWYNDGNVYGDDYLSQIWIPIVKEED